MPNTSYQPGGAGGGQGGQRERHNFPNVEKFFLFIVSLKYPFLMFWTASLLKAYILEEDIYTTC